MSREQPMNLLGWYVEESPEGRMQLVLVQPHAEEEYVEHVAETPEELWAAFTAIMADPGLPEAQHVVEPMAAAGGGDVRNFVINQAQGIVSDAAGPVFGRLAGELLRNPAIALEALRKISRNGGKPR